VDDAAAGAAVLERLRSVMDPEIPRDIVSLGMVKGVLVEGGVARIAVELTTPSCPLKDRIRSEVEAAARLVPGIASVEVAFTASVAARGPGLPLPNQARLGSIRNVVAVASGKGGVGKSTVASNLALALAADGSAVGLLDADIYGPSQPLLFGLTGIEPVVKEGKIHPPVAHGIAVMSMGFLVKDGQSVVWRGPMIHKALAQFFDDVAWGPLDYLVVDLPPGTGDAQLSLCQLVPMSGAVMVTTPQEVALIDVRKGADMFRRLKVPVLGLVENMSWFVCPCCGTRSDIFDHGGGEREAERWGVPFLGGIPIDPRVRQGGDAGVPVILSHPESESAAAFRAVARAVAGRVSVEVLGRGPSRGARLRAGDAGTAPAPRRHRRRGVGRARRRSRGAVPRAPLRGPRGDRRRRRGRRGGRHGRPRDAGGAREPRDGPRAAAREGREGRRRRRRRRPADPGCERAAPGASADGAALAVPPPAATA
jgi:ATP-binding protein involved in chromosome partitioning